MPSIAAFVVLTALTALAGTTAWAGPAITATNTVLYAAPSISVPGASRMTVIGTVSDLVVTPQSTPNGPSRFYTTNSAPYAIVDDSGWRLYSGIAVGGQEVSPTARGAPGVATASNPGSVPAVVPEPATVVLPAIGGTIPALNAIVDDTGAELNADIAFGELGVTTTASDAPAVVPEPATVALLGLGLLGWALARGSKSRPVRD